MNDRTDALVPSIALFLILLWLYRGGGKHLVWWVVREFVTTLIKIRAACKYAAMLAGFGLIVVVFFNNDWNVFVNGVPLGLFSLLIILGVYELIPKFLAWLERSKRFNDFVWRIMPEEERQAALDKQNPRSRTDA